MLFDNTFGKCDQDKKVLIRPSDRPYSMASKIFFCQISIDISYLTPNTPYNTPPVSAYGS